MRIIILGLFVISLSVCFAQNSIGLYTNPNFQFNKIDDVPMEIADSFKSQNERDFVFSFGIELRKQIDRDQAITFSPGFYQMSSLFVLKDLKLFDVIHPSLPEIRDQAQASPKIANLHYRFKYISAQLQYSRRINTSYKANAVSLEYSGALTYLYLVQQDIRMQTEGFALQGDFVHIIKDSIFFEGRKHNLLMSAGFDVIYPLTPDLNLFAGTLINIPLFTTTSNDPKIRNFSPGIKVGMRKLF